MTTEATVQPVLATPQEDLAELDHRQIPESDAARELGLVDLLPIMVSPDDAGALQLADDGKTVRSPGHSYPVVDGLPVLLPSALHAYVDWEAGCLRVPPARYEDALLQYFLISTIKQNHGDSNSPHDSIWYRRHVHRARELLTGATGLVLDVGADDPQISRRLLPRECRYVGLEPLFSERERFRLIGVAEFLPFRDASVDAVCFMTSLDHVLDYHRAIEEALRVLTPGGRIYLASLVWESDAELFRDHQHFHHFRLHELLGALRETEIVSVRRYGWKGDSHRHGLYLEARKAH